MNKKAMYWASPLSKIGDSFPKYEKTIRLFIAYACSYAERNLKLLGFGLFTGEKLKESDKQVYNKLVKKLKGISELSLEELNKQIDVLREIHNYSVHYYYKGIIKIDRSNINTQFSNLLDYAIADENDEITFFGALVTICRFVDCSQATSISRVFKSMFLKYKNPIYMDILDREKAVKALNKVIFAFCCNTPQLEKMSKEETKNNGFDTNTTFRSLIAELFYDIEKETVELDENSSNFANRLKTVGLADDKLIENFRDVRNWYCHGGYINEIQNGKEISPSFAINTIYDCYNIVSNDTLKKTFKNFAKELLINCFDMMAKYTIKLLDRRLIGDAFLLKKGSKIGTRAYNLYYHNPFRTGFYKEEDFEKLLIMNDNIYKSRYNDSMEFRNCKRNFETSILQFVTIYSKNNINIVGHDTGVKEMTLINPFYFDFKKDNDDSIHYVTINGFELTDIFPEKATKAISKIRVNLDEFEKNSQPVKPKDYLVYSIRDLKDGGIMFDYSITDEKFKNIESNSLNYVEDYQTIKKLLNRSNTLNVSYCIDTMYHIININEEFNLDNYNYSFINIIDLFIFVKKMLSLEERGNSIWKVAAQVGIKNINEMDKVELLKLILNRLIESSGIEYLSDFAEEANAKYKVKGSSIFRNGILVDPLKIKE